MKTIAGFLSVCALMGLSAFSFSPDVAAEKGKKAVCPVSKKAVSEDVFVEVNGKKTHLCCNGCVKTYLTKMLKVEDKGPGKCEFSGKPAKAETGVIHRTAEKVAFCCGNCQKGFMKKNGLVAKVNEKCPLSGKPGKADQFINVNGEKQLFCCGNCKKAYAKKLDVAKTDGDLKCPMSGKPGKEETAVVHVTHKKVYFCCNGCKGKYAKKHFAQGQKKAAKKG